MGAPTAYQLPNKDTQYQGKRAKALVRLFLATSFRSFLLDLASAILAAAISTRAPCLDAPGPPDQARKPAPPAKLDVKGVTPRAS